MLLSSSDRAPLFQKRFHKYSFGFSEKLGLNELHFSILQNINEAPKPLPRTKLDDQKNFDLPELPSVPSDSSAKTDDIDFDDLNRRFEALKKK